MDMRILHYMCYYLSSTITMEHRDWDEIVRVTIVERPDGIMWEYWHNTHKKLKHTHTTFVSKDLEHIIKNTPDKVAKLLYSFLP